MFLNPHPTRLAAFALFAAASCVVAAQPVTDAQWEASRLDNGMRYLTYRATAPLLGKPTPVKVNFFCYPFSTKTEKGTLGFEIHVSDIAALKPFRFEDFEGPDAASNGKKLLRISVARPGKPAFVVDSLVSGSSPDAKAFTFSIAQESQLAKSTERTVLQALADDADSVQMTITDTRNAKLKLEFTVPVVGKHGDFKTLLAGLK